MAGERFDVYLSSTKADLAAERAIVTKLVCDHLSWSLKHSYSASPQRTLESCLADVRCARLYIGIIGMRHGSTPPDSEWSYTRHEFEEAHRHCIPTFVFLKQIEHVDRQRSAIDDFRERVSVSTRVAPFQTADELRDELSKCQREMEEKNKRAQRTEGDAPSANEAIRGLLATDRAFVQLPAELPERWARIQAELHAQLEETYRASRSLELLHGLWISEPVLPCSDDGAPLPTSAINQLTRLIERCNERRWLGVSRTPEHTMLRQQSCQAAMKLLFALAPTQPAWQPEQWLAERGALPFMHHHMLMAVFSVVAGKNFHLDAGHEDDGGLLRSDWVLDLGGVETGIGSDRQRHLEQQIATRFAYRKSQPVRPDGRLREFDRRTLASRVKNRSDIDQRVYVVTELLDSDTGPDPGLVQTAQALNTRPLPRKDAACDRLRVDEFDLADAVYQCLSAIRNIP